MTRFDPLREWLLAMEEQGEPPVDAGFSRQIAATGSTARLAEARAMAQGLREAN